MKIDTAVHIAFCILGFWLLGCNMALRKPDTRAESINETSTETTPLALTAHEERSDAAPPEQTVRDEAPVKEVPPVVVKLRDVSLEFPGGFEVIPLTVSKVKLIHAGKETTVEMTIFDASTKRPDVVRRLSTRGPFRDKEIQVSNRMLGAYLMRDATFWATDMLDSPRYSDIRAWWYGWQADISLPNNSHLYISAQTRLGQGEREEIPKEIAIPDIITALQKNVPQTVLWEDRPLEKVAPLPGDDKTLTVEWKQITLKDASGEGCSFPKGRYGAALFAYEGALYLFGGAYRIDTSYHTQRFNDLWQFSPDSNCWKHVAVTAGDGDMPEGGYRRGIPLEIAPGKWVFSPGPGPGTFNELYVLDMKQRAWSRLPVQGKRPGARRGYATLLADDEMVWINGAGPSGIVSKQPVIAYNLKKQTWRTVPILGPRFSLSNSTWCGFLNKEGICFADDDDSLRTLDWNSKQWQRLETTMSPLPMEDDAAVRNGDAVYVFNGEHREFWRLDVTQKQWQLILPESEMPSTRTHAAAAMLGTRFYLFGGWGKNPRFPGDFWVADLSGVAGLAELNDDESFVLIED